MATVRVGIHVEVVGEGQGGEGGAAFKIKFKFLTIGGIPNCIISRGMNTKIIKNIMHS